MREALKPEDLQQYAIMGREADFKEALQDGAVPTSGIVNVKSANGHKTPETGKTQNESKLYKKSGKSQHGGSKRSGSRNNQNSKKQRT